MGRRAGGRRQRYRCFPPGSGKHDFIEPITLDLVGACATCRRDWDGGFPILQHAYFTIPTVVEFLRNIGRGDSLRLAAENARIDRQDLAAMRRTMTGQGPAGNGAVSRDGRASADWLGRYGYLVVRELMASAWPEATLIVDAQPFQAKSSFPKRHPRAGQPKPAGTPAFAILGAGTRVPAGSKRKKNDLKIVHARAFPNDNTPSWADFFRSLPGAPTAIISDPDPQIAYAIKEVWRPGERPRHLLSTWHYRNKVGEKFIRARWYPTTHPLADDALHAFSDPGRFALFRIRAMLWGPAPVKAWLRAKGDEVQARLEAAPPTSTSDLDTFLGDLERHLRGGKGRITNLSRLDIRLGLRALSWNRQNRRDRYRQVLLEHLRDARRPQRVWRRRLDGEFYVPRWVMAS